MSNEVQNRISCLLALLVLLFCHLKDGHCQLYPLFEGGTSLSRLRLLLFPPNGTRGTQKQSQATLAHRLTGIHLAQYTLCKNNRNQSLSKCIG